MIGVQRETFHPIINIFVIKTFFVSVCATIKKIVELMQREVDLVINKNKSMRHVRRD